MHASAEPRWSWRLPRQLRMLADYLRLMRLDKPIGIALLLWPTLWALWAAAGGVPTTRLLILFIAGTIIMRSAGCVANDLIDRDIDPHVRRTRDRPLAARRISPHGAIVLLLLLLVAALGLALQLNAAALELAVVGAALTLTYPFCKRFLPIPQLYLGLCFGWGVPMAFAAVQGSVPRAGWLLLAAAVVWAGVYDTFYAMVDRNDDRRIGVRSSAVSFGDADLLMIGVMQLMVLLALVLAGRILGLGNRFYLSLAAGALLFVWQQWRANARDRAGCFEAFKHNNYFGLVVLLGIAAAYAAR